MPNLMTSKAKVDAMISRHGKENLMKDYCCDCGQVTLHRITDHAEQVGYCLETHKS